MGRTLPSCPWYHPQLRVGSCSPSTPCSPSTARPITQGDLGASPSPVARDELSMFGWGGKPLASRAGGCGRAACVLPTSIPVCHRCSPPFTARSGEGPWQPSRRQTFLPGGGKASVGKGRNPLSSLSWGKNTRLKAGDSVTGTPGCERGHPPSVSCSADAQPASPG